jgi:hypothetical protein
VEGRAERGEQLARLPVLGVGGVLGEAAGDEHGIRLLPQLANRLDSRGKRRDRIVASPVGPDVQVAQLDEQEGIRHNDRRSYPRLGCADR